MIQDIRGRDVETPEPIMANCGAVEEVDVEVSVAFGRAEA